MKRVLLYLLLLYSVFVDAQNYAYSNWLLRDQVVDFSMENPIVVKSTQIFNNEIAVSDNNGVLMLYGGSRNGFVVYDNMGNILISDERFASFATSFAVTSKYPDCAFVCASFKEKDGKRTPTVFMVREDGGKAVLSGRFVLPSDSYDHFVTFVNGRTGILWLLLCAKNEIRSYRVSDVGVDYVSKYEISGNLYGGRYPVCLQSPDMSSIFVKTDRGVCIIKFDSNSGMVEGLDMYDIQGLSGLEFSESGDFLYYITSLYSGNSIVTEIRRQRVINDSRGFVLDYENAQSVAMRYYDTDECIANADIRLAPNGKIYVGQTGYRFVSCIEESSDGKCMFRNDALDLGKNKAFGFGFPCFLRKYLTFVSSSKCNRVIELAYQGYPYESLLWDFGDGTPIDNNAYPVHHYEKPGKYVVTMTVAFENGIVKEVKKNIDVMDINKPKVVKE